MSQPYVVSVNVSSGGIPKRPVPFVFISESGLEGDGHNHEKHYRSIQAVSLQDIEKLEELNRQGYWLACGSTGENINVSGLNVNALPLGCVLDFAGGVRIELTKIRQPCYVLDSINPKLKTDIRGRCGMYAKVVRPGNLTVGESITINFP